MFTITDYERGLLVSWAYHQELPPAIAAIIGKLSEAVELPEELTPPSLSDILEKIEKHRGRITKALRGTEVDVIGDLLDLTSFEFMRLPNVGFECLLHLQKALGAFDLELREF
jgi:hypothetical protein